MAQAYVKTHTGATGQSGVTATVSVVSATAGNHLRLNIKISSDSRTISTVADNSGGGTTWLDTGESADDLTNNKQRMWYLENIPSGSYTITITFDSSAATQVEAWADEYSGTATSSSLDVHTSHGAAVGASPLSVGPTGTTTQANAMAYTCGCSMSASGTLRPLTVPPSGYTTAHSGQPVNTNANQMASAHLVLSATGTQSV
ncbi:MAG TPA: hypothetical protein VJS20_12810, partial [Gemmatimonadales bacterium]|nr:hypothetical protein [Gemmatimonadales bacterium]